MIRPAAPSDAADLARVWHDAWHDGHDGHVPAGLVAARTQQTFDDRVGALLPRALVAEVDGRVVGFVTTEGSEVDLLFVGRSARGGGVATALLSAAEAGIPGTPWLSVVTGNARARRFYERQGYADAGELPEEVVVDGTAYDVPGRRYVKQQP
jgi:GNAT superfamily N-acetyltransferase